MNISVIIPTYKPQKYIEDCLESLKNQTYNKHEFEIIIVLNGCCEPYKSQLQSYIYANLDDYNVVLIQSDESGVSKARNIGLDVAQGDYITFIDDDDYVSKEYLEESYSNSSDDTIAICYPYAFKDGDSVQMSYSMTDQYNARASYGKQSYIYARKFFSGPCMKLIPRHCIGHHRFDVNFKNGEDTLFMFEISENFRNVKFTSMHAVYFRRYREGSAVFSFTNQGFRKVVSNTASLIWAYSKVYFSNIHSYNFVFYITRILGTIRKLALFIKIV